MNKNENFRKILQSFKYGDVFPETDQDRGLEPYPIEKEVDPTKDLLSLPDPFEFVVKKNHPTQCIFERKSRRSFNSEPISIAELSYLLWATQGVRKISEDYTYLKRTVPSAGSRHPFETYISIHNVDNLEPGIYRYISSVHKLMFSHSVDNFHEDIIEATCNQKFCATAPALFCWSAIPYRTEWRYGNFSSKCVLLDAGHVCQNLYIACEALGLGTCGIGAYFQDKIDTYFGLDGEEEMAIYLAPVGHY